MGSSDSDSESERFESAEESFDENEEVKNEKTKLKKKLQKNENEAEKPVVSGCSLLNLERAEEANTSSNLLSYRKRPERMKLEPKKIQTKHVPKSSTSELIFKTDKIAPDVFLQDITSNLSKNLNKGISTLQQTSSNVKDMILNSLPVSSITDNEGFSYDDKTITVADESKPLSLYQNKDQTLVDENVEENISHPIGQSIKLHESNVEEKKEENSNKKTDISAISRIYSSKSERKLTDIENNSLKNNTLLNEDTKNNNIKKEILSFDKQNFNESNSSSLILDNMKVLFGQNCSEAVNNISIKTKEDNQKFSKTCLNHEELEILVNQTKEQVNREDKIKSSTLMEDTKKESDKSKKRETEINMEIKTDKDSFEPEKLLEMVRTKDENNQGLVRCDENDFNYLIKEKSNINTECNLEELKTVLKNMVVEENISTQQMVNLEDSIEDNKNVMDEGNVPGKEIVNLGNNIKVNQSSGDGWDDFDFSDDEVENNNINQNIKGKNSEYSKTNNHLTKSKKEVTEVDSLNDVKALERKISNNLISNKENVETISVGTTKDKNKVKNTSSFIKEKKHAEESSKKTEKPKCEDTSMTENDLWDWDNWDEISESKEVEATSNNKSEIRKVSDNSSDLSKWSGWDMFAQKTQEKQDNWSLGSWGVDMLLQKATVVTQGISSVLEAGLGAPDPETLARMEKIQNKNIIEPSKKVEHTENEEPPEMTKKNSLTNVNIFPVSGITSLVAGVTSKIVEHSKIQEIGSKVITGSLDTLETFGKKTMEVLQEGDPGLKNKRALLLGNNKPVLSQVLKEAREKAEEELKKVKERELARKCHFETLFDDFQGLVHLEALEMLSKQCELKLDQIKSGMTSEEQDDLNGILEEVEQLCSLDEYEMDIKSAVLDFKTVLQMAVEPLKNEISTQNIIQIHEEVNKWLQLAPEADPSFTIIHQKLVSTLAELTAATVHQFHKIGELLSVKECHKTVEEVDVLSRLTNVLCTEINKLGEKFILLFCSRSSKEANGESINSMKEKVNIVTKNSVFYIKQAFDLLIPVIQFGAAV